MNNRQRMEQLYALPAPLRTFPLPTFIPHNPLSLIHVLYVWISQAINRPTSSLVPLYQGVWSPETRSVHVTDDRSVRGLWEQGFYGKGTLSRSEPNWMDREKNRTGADKAASRSTAEENTLQRRAIRQQTKWERARKERDAIDQTRLEEAALEQAMLTAKIEPVVDELPELSMDSDTSVTASESDLVTPNSTMAYLPPTGPMELLLLPNTISDLHLQLKSRKILELETLIQQPLTRKDFPAPVGPQELLALPNSFHELDTILKKESEPVNCMVSKAKMNLRDQTENSRLNGNSTSTNNHINNYSDDQDEFRSGFVVSNDNRDNFCALRDILPQTPTKKRSKSVRFSPTIENNTFMKSEPPSPGHPSSKIVEAEPQVVVSKEHFQLTMQETFFLTYALGSLTVINPVTQATIPNKDLFDLFRMNSSFPPLSSPSLSPDDSFMTSYVVYHHFRSLGWCVRGGAKFSCDFMLYQRGPPFTHAEYSLLIIPSYTDEYWSSDALLQNYVKGKQMRSWHWLHCINRVTTQAKKTLVLVYVDIPKPLSAESEKNLGIDRILERYKVREFIVKRWSRDRER